MDDMLIRCFSEDVEWTEILPASSSLGAEGRKVHSLSSVRMSMPTIARTRGSIGSTDNSSATLFYLSSVSTVDGSFLDSPAIKPGDTIKDSQGKGWTVMSTLFLEGIQGEYRHMEVTLK